MTLVAETAFAAIESALTGVANLPPVPARNDRRLTGFAPSGVAGVNWKLVLFDEAPDVLDTSFGDAPTWELSAPITVVFMVEGEAGAARDGVWQAGLEALAATLFPAGRGLTVPGVIEDLRWQGAEREHILEAANLTPVEALEFTVTAIVTASTPFG